MIAEERHETEGEHHRHEEQEQDVEPSHVAQLVLKFPELDEVLESGARDVDAVNQRIAEEQNEELVVSEVDAVVHPRTVMVHFQYTLAAHRAMVGSVGFHYVTFFTVPYTIVICSI